MPYIGTSPSNGVRRVHTYTATEGQTTFTGASNEGQTLSYVDTNYIDVTPVQKEPLLIKGN